MNLRYFEFISMNIYCVHHVEIKLYRQHNFLGVSVITLESRFLKEGGDGMESTLAWRMLYYRLSTLF